MQSVVSRVSLALHEGRKVWLCGRFRGESYSLEVHAIRIDRSGEFLLVNTDKKKSPKHWSTVWYSEYLQHEYGEVLYSQLRYEEMTEEDMDGIFERFFQDFGILPWCGKRAA